MLTQETEMLSCLKITFTIYFLNFNVIYHPTHILPFCYDTGIQIPIFGSC